MKPRTVFAFMFYITFCYLVVMQFEVPESLQAVVTGLLGFYFGQRTKKGVDNGKEKVV